MYQNLSEQNLISKQLEKGESNNLSKNPSMIVPVGINLIEGDFDGETNKIYRPIVSTGMIITLDDRGTLTLPSEVIQLLHISCNDQLEIYTDGNLVFIAKNGVNKNFCSS
ncbi:AbrB/MazE/SpoVT family DNA-binding domain-containing protein [Alicyclobacillus tolerans]|uniref:Looped-hinge helix DNA binding domain-containing protein, AbrB family n=1 Tax=Alicyclobacillus tolerans TaxID=90970 RepID=A0A1M6TGI7_9BACL|nr:AbrB/MazE/SpoVT family DNA-binding domain-containing protein [Alicyclobacillus montanus]SHK56142.1 hypothetical protein SAMN05443507_11673 [Alicyclobacillus montanus]